MGDLGPHVQVRPFIVGCAVDSDRGLGVVDEAGYEVAGAEALVGIMTTVGEGDERRVREASGYLLRPPRRGHRIEAAREDERGLAPRDRLVLEWVGFADRAEQRTRIEGEVADDGRGQAHPMPQGVRTVRFGCLFIGGERHLFATLHCEVAKDARRVVDRVAADPHQSVGVTVLDVDQQVGNQCCTAGRVEQAVEQSDEVVTANVQRKVGACAARHGDLDRIGIDLRDDGVERRPRVGEVFAAFRVVDTGLENLVERGSERVGHRTDQVLLDRVDPAQDHRSDLLRVISEHRLGEAGPVAVAI